MTNYTRNFTKINSKEVSFWVLMYSEERNKVSKLKTRVKELEKKLSKRDK